LGTTALAGRSLNQAIASSALGIAWLASLLGPQGYSVEEVPIGEEYLHLDVALSNPRHGLAVACTDAFVNGLLRHLDGWDIIEATADEVRRLSLNCLTVDSENFMMGVSEQADGRSNREALESRGIAVHAVPFRNHMKDGGALRCATHPLTLPPGQRIQWMTEGTRRQLTAEVRGSIGSSRSPSEGHGCNISLH
jgi:glycine amidinotransferase